MNHKRWNATACLCLCFVVYGQHESNHAPELHDHMFIAIKCAPPTVIAGLRGKLPVQNDKACDALTELVLRQVDHEHRGVFDWSPPPPTLFPKMP
jgi:hypothetical protein